MKVSTAGLLTICCELERQKAGVTCQDYVPRLGQLHDFEPLVASCAYFDPCLAMSRGCQLPPTTAKLSSAGPIVYIAARSSLLSGISCPD